MAVRGDRITDVAILTGPKRSGKTTRLRDWAGGRDDVAGLLQPEGPTGRAFVDVPTGAIAALEPVAPGEGVVTVGRFRFRAAAFEWANARLRSAVEAQPRFVVIDEAGPLELAGGGLAPGLRAVLAGAAGTLLLVVRDELAEAVRRALAPQARIVACAHWPQAGHADAPTP